MLLEKGCSVIIADLKLRPESQALLDQYPKQEGSDKPFALFQKTDVADWGQIMCLWSMATETLPSIDIVVPGAGIFEPPSSSFWQAPKTDTNPETASQDDAHAKQGHYSILDVNLIAPIRFAQLAIGYWTTNKKKGDLIFVGSLACYTSGATTPLYYTSKHGLNGFVRSLSPLRDQLGIRVSCVTPGKVIVSQEPSVTVSLRPSLNISPDPTMDRQPPDQADD